jgi:hypothetical protein
MEGKQKRGALKFTLLNESLNLADSTIIIQGLSYNRLIN